MSNDEPNNNNNTRGLPFPRHFNFGTTIQSVFRNINHAFAGNHDHSSGQQRDNGSRDHAGGMPPLEPLSSVAEARDARPTDFTHPSVSSVGHSPPAPADVDMPPNSQPESQRDDDDDSMPDLRSVSESSEESDAGIAPADPVPSHLGAQPISQDHGSVRMNGQDQPSLEPIAGTRRARVEDDEDDDRDRRHPSERVGGPPPSGEAAPQGANPPQQPRTPAGLFGALFGLGPPGDAPPDHVQTGEDDADPSSTGNDAAPGRALRGVPVMTAGFTLTIPLFGSPPGNQTGAPAGAQGLPPNLFGMDAASREELFTQFAAFLQEFQAGEEGREDPERAKKLVAGLEVVPLGLVKRLERVGGAPGGHAGDANAEGTSSGCAICWDTLLDGESDNFTGQHSSGGDAPQSSTSGSDTVERQDATHASGDTMDVDAPSSSPSQSGADTSTAASPSSDATAIISLPCAHVFHASCLLPWFTRAKQATCPTCRFNIDPENLTYTPLPRRAFHRPPPAQPSNAAPNPNPAPAGPQAAPEAATAGAHGVDAAAPPVDLAGGTADAPPAAAAVPPPTGQAGAVPGGLGPNPFNAIPGIPVLSFPAIQIPLGPTAAQVPGGGGNQGTSFLSTASRSRTVILPSSTNEYPFAHTGMDVLTIGLDMFVGGLPPEARDPNPRDNAAGATDANNGATGTGAAGGNGGANPNGLAQDLQTLIEGLLRTTRNIIPQVINAQGAAPPPGPGAHPAQGPQPPQGGPASEAAGAQPPADGAGPQPQAGPVPQAAGPQGVPPPGGPRAVPNFPFRPMMFRPTRPMPPRRERKTWTLPLAPGPSLRQRVEQREREQGLRCSDTSCGIGPSDDDPYPEAYDSSTNQVFIHPHLEAGDKGDVHAAVCAHAFHPACLVSAERVAGWGGEDKSEPLVEVSCPVCRAVGCVTREEWESGVATL